MTEEYRRLFLLLQLFSLVFSDCFFKGKLTDGELRKIGRSLRSTLDLVEDRIGPVTDALCSDHRYAH